MSSRSSTAPVDDDDDDMRAMLAAMTQNTPPKRTHIEMVGGSTSDNEEMDSGSLPIVRTNQNVAAAARHYAERKRLRGDQLTDLDVFMKEPASLREAKIITNLWALSNQLEKIIASKPTFEVSADLEMNIKKYSDPVLLSTKITCYKGEAATHILEVSSLRSILFEPRELIYTLKDLIKKHRFGLPPGLENVPADWAKVVVVIRYHLTQGRARIKKEIGWSLKVHKTDDQNAPPSQQKNIFELAQAIVKGTQCSVSVALCARVAVMRAAYLVNSGLKYWDYVDKRFAKIRAEANGDPKMLTRGFRFALTSDQDKHGSKDDYTLDETAVDEFQQKVDDLIDIGVVDAASSAQDEDAE
ncbi:hypothetical protein K438DRAFT_1997844 [Mycena galopus ATCC 62051]|nr:hypothetical protein K438DRAFT_1997844 [Mycena galopus ATCC 62051]